MGNRVEFTVPGDATVEETLSTEVLVVDGIEVDTTGALDKQTLIFDGTKYAPAYTYNPGGEPIGFADRAESTVSFTNSSPDRTFTITPVGSYFDVWCKGVRYRKTVAESIQITASNGPHNIYYSASGVLSTKTGFFDLENEAPVASIYWNSSTSSSVLFGDERHGVTLDWATHEYLHRTRGAAIASGFNATNFTTTGDGSNNADAQIDIGNGTFFDEDIEVAITHSATPTVNTWQQRLQGGAYIPMFYMTGSSVWTKDVATQYPMKYGTAAYYNYYNSGTGSWSAELLGSNKYGITWIVASNNLNEPIVGILGQAEYNNIGDAEEVVWADMTLTGVPIYEFKVLYKIIYQTNSSYTNVPSSHLVSVTDLRSATSFASGIPSTPTADHGLLTGLEDDDHPQYVLAAGDTMTGSLTLRAGTATAGTAPAYLQSGTNLTTPVAGAVEWDGTNVFVTNGAGRKTVAYTDSNITGSAASATTATTATQLATSRNFSLTGNVTASAVGFDGTAAVALATTIASGVITNSMLSTTAGGIGGASTSFTPTLYAGSTAATVSGTGSNRTGAYIQIGKIVFYWFNIQFSTVSGSSLNGGTGTYRISLPVAANLFPDSSMNMGTLRLTNVTVSAVANQMGYFAGPILDNVSVSGVWTANYRYSSAYPFGTDTTLGTGNAGAQLNTANSTRFAGVIIYEAV